MKLSLAPDWVGRYCIYQYSHHCTDSALAPNDINSARWQHSNPRYYGLIFVQREEVDSWSPSFVQPIVLSYSVIVLL